MGKVGGAERLLRVGAGLLVAYLVLVAVPKLPGQGETDELFPIFAWSLFSRVPGDVQEGFDVRIVALDGVPFDEPVAYGSVDVALTGEDVTGALDVIDAMGAALRDGRTDAADDARALFESRFLREADQVTYEVIEVTYTTEERYECRCVVEGEVLGRFEVTR